MGKVKDQMIQKQEEADQPSQHVCYSCGALIYDEVTKTYGVDGTLEGDNSICTICDDDYSDCPEDDLLDYVYGSDGWRDQ